MSQRCPALPERKRLSASGNGAAPRRKKSHWHSELRPVTAAMKLEQGQIWKQGDDYYRIVVWQRLVIEYKAMKDPVAREGTHHKVTKKEFCRLIKGAELLPPGQFAAAPED